MSDTNRPELALTNAVRGCEIHPSIPVFPQYSSRSGGLPFLNHSHCSFTFLCTYNTPHVSTSGLATGRNSMWLFRATSARWRGVLQDYGGGHAPPTRPPQIIRPHGGSDRAKVKVCERGESASGTSSLSHLTTGFNRIPTHTPTQRHTQSPNQAATVMLMLCLRC